MERSLDYNCQLLFSPKAMKSLLENNVLTATVMFQVQTARY